jgi:hypothetical protein
MSLQELTERFYMSFYGPKSFRMDEVYRLLSNQAEFWNTSWEWEESKHRSPIIGSSGGIFDQPKPAKDQALPPLPVPSAVDLSLNMDWNSRNKDRLQAAEKAMQENKDLMQLLQENLSRVDDKLYNIQVLRSVAQLCRQNLTMLLDLQRINDLLRLAANAASAHPAVAVGLIDQAIDQARRIRDERNEVLQAVTAVWYQDWHPRVAEANGRKYLDQVDDVKDHEPVRTVDMSYLIYRQLKYPLGQWAEAVNNTRNRYGKLHNLPIRSDSLSWESY